MRAPSDFQPRHADGPLNTAFGVIFEHESAAGKAFDVILIAAILASVAVVMLDSVARYRAELGHAFLIAEWGFTLLFTVEYALRIAVVRTPRRYILSFYGLVDLAAVLPTYIALLFPAGRYLLVVRILRVLRIFRVLKLAAYTGEADVLVQALRASRRKILLFIFTVLTLVVVIGSLMYLIEGADAGFDSIPRSVYWAIVTLTTVGYGDIAPLTPVGQALAAMVMIIGYGIIAVPTGIVTVELGNVKRQRQRRPCPACDATDHDGDARFCKRCGHELAPPR